MKPVSKLKLRLRTKILLIALGLPFTCIILFGAVSYLNIMNMGAHAEVSIRELGYYVAEYSQTTLETHAKTQLEALASDQTAFIDATLQRVITEVNYASVCASRLWNQILEEGEKHTPLLDHGKVDQGTAHFKLAPGLDRDEVERELLFMPDIMALFESIFTNTTSIVYIYIGTESGIMAMHPWQGELDDSYDPRQDAWYQRAVDAGGIQWSETFVFDGINDLMITCSTPFFGLSGEVLGVVGMDVNIQPIVNKVLKTSVGVEGYAFLMEKSGNLIVRPSLKPQDKRWDESFSTKNLMITENADLKAIAENMAAGRKGLSKCRFEQVNKYIAYAPLASIEWSLGLVMPSDEITTPILTSIKGIADIISRFNSRSEEEIKSARISFVLLFLTVIVIAAFFGVRQANKLTEPILALARGAKVIGGGKLDHIIEIRTGDEIEGLADAFNKMAEDLKIYVEESNKRAASKERIEQTKLIFSGLRSPEENEYSFDPLVPYMRGQEFKKDEVVFNKGDQSDKLYYIQKGSVRIVEINKRLSEGNIIGEMGFFRPSKNRTMTAVCETDAVLLHITHDALLDVYYQDPTVGFNFIPLITHRLIENMKAETKKKERIESELRIARDIQASSLPRVFPAFPDRKEFDVYACMKPAEEVGGDLYDFFFIDDHRLCFLIGDVSGKGVPAAIFMMTTKTLLKTETMRGRSVDEVLRTVNNIIASENDTSMFITLFYGILDTRSGELVYGNAGHNRPLLCRAGQGFSFIFPKANFVLGPMEGTEFEFESLKLEPGDTVFLYTDGVTEATNSDGQLYSDERLHQTLSGLKGKDVSGMIAGVNDDLEVFTRHALQYDDITMLAVRYNG